jgi:hypothetical protein
MGLLFWSRLTLCSVRRRREDSQTPAVELSWKTWERSAHCSSTVATKFNRAVRFGVGFTDLLNIYGLGVSEQTKYIEIYKWAVARGTRLPNCLRKPTASDLRASNEFADKLGENRQSEYNDQRKAATHSIVAQNLISENFEILTCMSVSIESIV